MRFLVPCLLFPLFATPAAALPPPSAVEIAHLIEQLGSRSFQEREAASKQLEAMGVPAMGALQKAVNNAKDVEVRRRAEAVRGRILAEEGKRLHGTWVVMGCEYDWGQVVYNDIREEYTFDRGRLVYKGQGLTLVSYRLGFGPSTAKGTYRVTGLGAMDIDIQDIRAPRATLYRLDGDTLTLCVRPFGERPTKIETRGGTDVRVYTLKRQP
jgi:uncharacterized protein (TIGR03067 family)